MSSYPKDAFALQSGLHDYHVWVVFFKTFSPVDTFSKQTQVEEQNVRTRKCNTERKNENVYDGHLLSETPTPKQSIEEKKIQQTTRRRIHDQQNIRSCL